MNVFDTPFKLFLGAVVLAVLGLLVNAVVPRATPEAGSGGPRLFDLEPSLTSHPTPGRPGPYTVCDHPRTQYDLTLPTGHRIQGRIYAPVLDARTCETVERAFNLVVIAHADGQDDPHTTYDTLARHLASHALMVVSIHRYPGASQSGAWQVFDEVLTRNLEWLYNSGESGIEDYLSDNIALIGHSAGGRSVLENAEAVAAFGKDLRAVVLMSPTLGQTPVDFNSVSPALLSLHAIGDRDATAYGILDDQSPVLSAFKAYDDAGLTADEDTFGLEKTMVYGPAETHYYQDELWLRTYVNAFLQLHLNGHAIYRRFLKYQERPVAFGQEDPAAAFFIQHEDLQRLTLDNFEDEDPDTNRFGANNLFVGAGFGLIEEGRAYEVDPFSPHNSGVLRVQVTGIPTTDPSRIVIPFNGPTNLGNFRHLGFRIAQAYHPDLNPDGTNQSFWLRIVTSGGTDTVPLTDHGLSVRFPSVRGLLPGMATPSNPAPGVDATNAATKNAMHSYLIPFRAFEGIDITRVEEIQFVFDGIDGTTIFLLDDVAFYRI